MEREQLVTLVTAAQQGNNSAMNALFNVFYNDLYYFALKTVKDDELALDITQEAFVEIIKTLGSLKEPAAFVTWAKQITYHKCVRYFNKKKDLLVDEDEDGNTVFDTLKEDNAEFIPDQALDQSDFKKIILAILDELSEEQRSAVMMYYFDEMSVKEIAEIQGVSEGTVKSRLNYARKAIKEAVEEYEKKNNIKLHAIPFFPFFGWLFNGTFEGGLPTASAQIIAEGVTAATGTTVTVGASTAATVAATTAATIGIAAKIAAIPLAVKIIAVSVAAAIVVGGATTAVILTNNDNNDNVNTDVQSDVSTIVDADGKNDITKIPMQDNADGELVLQGNIPEGCTYTLTDGTILTAGQAFPEKCTAGDVVKYGDYVYGYECIYNDSGDGSGEWHLWKDGFDSGDSGVVETDVFESWSVIVTDKSKQSYGVVAAQINGKPIKTLYATYYDCKQMVNAPRIPSTITAMTATYYGCSSLVTAPIIPSGVQRMMVSFKGCTALTGDVEINATLDKSLEWFYSDTFGSTTGKLNLVGATPEEDLILIAKASDNPNITVNGKRVVDVVQGDSNITQEDFEIPKEDSENNQEDSVVNQENSVVTLDKYIADTVDDYVSRLLFSELPYFTSADKLTPSNAFWFIFYGLDLDKYYSLTFDDGTTHEDYYQIPISVLTSESNNIFGINYDFSSINEYSPFAGMFKAKYVVSDNGEDYVHITASGGAGTDYHPETTKLNKLNDDTYQADIAWYSASSEKPTDENADYYYNEETGDYWIADKWEKMTLKIVHEEANNRIYVRVRVVSYSGI